MVDEPGVSEPPGVGRLLLAVVVVAVLVLDVVAVWASVVRYRDQQDTALEEMALRAEERAVLMGQLVLSAFEQLNALGSTDAARSGDPARLWSSLSQFDAASAGFTGGVGWVDATGILRVISGPENGQVDVSVHDRDWVAAGLAGERFVGMATVSRVLDRPVVSIALPTRGADGNVNGVLSGNVLLERTGRMLGAVASGADALIVDRAGHVIVADRPTGTDLVSPDEAWPASRLAAAGTAVGVTDPVGRTERVVAWAPVPAAGWTFVLSRPHVDVLGSASRELVMTLVVVVLASMALLMLTVLLGRSLERRYRVLQDAAATAEGERRRNAAMAEAMADLASVETAGEAAEIVVHSGMPLFGAHAAGISLLDQNEPDHLVNIASAGWSEEHRRGWRRFRISDDVPVGEAFLRGEPVFVTAEELPERYPVVADAMLATGAAAWAALPLLDGTRPIGTLSASFDAAELLDVGTRLRLELFAERVSNALTRLERQEADHELAVAFQRAVIPTHMPAIRGVQVEGHYLPASRAIGVGGDWYDAFRVGDHALMVVCGDVVGHGLTAAAAASRLRVATATLAQTHRPAALLERLDEMVVHDPDALYSSMACLLIDSARRAIEYSIAGHPAPVKIGTEGLPEEFADGRGQLLGVTRNRRPTGWTPWVDSCRTVLMYTDGLVERRREPYDTGVQRLLAACAATRFKPRTAKELADSLTHDTRIDDDVTAVLVHLDATQLGQPGRPDWRGQQGSLL